MLLKIVLVLALVLVLFLLVIAFRPSHYRVERSIGVAASPAAVFPHVNDLRKAAVWSPWLKMDPKARTSYEGPASGVGATSIWDGNNQIGAGRQTIVESRPDELVRVKLEFFKPMKGVSEGGFVLKPDGGGTRVTWSIEGENGFLAKAFCLFMDQDNMIGGQFEKGLADLKALVEDGAKQAAPPL